MEAQLIALEKKIKQLISLIESAQGKNKGLETTCIDRSNTYKTSIQYERGKSSSRKNDEATS